MRCRLVLLPLAMPIALFVGCEGTSQNDTTTTDSALESCFASSTDGSTKCSIQGGDFKRDPQDVDHDGRPDPFVCAHIVKVPHGWIGGGGSSDAALPDASGGARPALPPVPSDADCDRMGCQDQRPGRGGPGAGSGGANGKVTPPPADAADDMKCPGHGPQGPGQGAGGMNAGDPSGHGPGVGGAGIPGTGPEDGHGDGPEDGHGDGHGTGHGAGGAGAP